ncbi:MAG: hypothetical protein ACU85V_15235 [Gammaproteobacteria bacterium]
MSQADDSTARPVDEVFDAVNAGFERQRHPRAARGDEPPAVAASLASVDYINAFWPHLARHIEQDPDRLGTSFLADAGGERRRVSAEELRQAFIDDPANAGDPQAAARLAGILTSLAVMSQVLNAAVADWAEDFAARPPRCPLSFEVDVETYVSLRMLLKRREARGQVAGNAPTLVMGGTATAVTMCWNLLAEIPRAYGELTGEAPSRAAIEDVWADTRELIFRIGSGSLAAFVAFASACSSDSAAMRWDGAGDLGLTRRGERYAWTMNAALEARFEAMLARVQADQQGAYVGCAALYARAPALPLDSAWADPVDAERPQVVFAELVRWIAAVARRQYFPAFPATDR